MDICLACKIRKGTAPRRRRFFQFPQTKDTLVERRTEKWLEALNLPSSFEIDLAHHKVCSEHFVSGRPGGATDIHNVDWVPTVNLPYQAKEFVECFAAGCNHNKKEKICRFYSFPKNDIMRKRWLRLVNLAGTKKYTRHCLVCGCHFPKGDVRKLPVLSSDGNKDNPVNSTTPPQVPQLPIDIPEQTSPVIQQTPNASVLQPSKFNIRHIEGLASVRDHSGYCLPIVDINPTNSYDIVDNKSGILNMKSVVVQTDYCVSSSMSTQTDSFMNWSNKSCKGTMTESYRGLLTYECLKMHPRMFHFFVGLTLNEFDVFHEIIDADEHIYRLVRPSQFSCHTIPWSQSKDALLLVLIKIRRGYSYREMSILCMVHTFSLRELIKKWNSFLYKQLIGRPLEVDFKDTKEVDVDEEVTAALEKAIYGDGAAFE